MTAVSCEEACANARRAEGATPRTFDAETAGDATGEAACADSRCEEYAAPRVFDDEAAGGTAGDATSPRIAYPT